MNTRRPQYAPEIYPELGRKLSEIHADNRAAFGNRRADLIDAIAKDIEMERLDRDMNLAKLRDLAWWCGAASVGQTVATACHAIAVAWVSYRELERASVDSPAAKRRLINLRQKRAAHAEGIPVREYVARQKRHESITHAHIRDRAFQHAIIGRHAGASGRTFANFSAV